MHNVQRPDSLLRKAHHLQGMALVFAHSGNFSAEQVVGWARVTIAVDTKGATIFIQLMHTGTYSHPLNLPQGAHMRAPSAIAADGEMYTDAQGMKAHPVPIAMTRDDIISTQKEFVTAATLVATGKGKVGSDYRPLAYLMTCHFMMQCAWKVILRPAKGI
jgi:hypothetical protein